MLRLLAACPLSVAVARVGKMWSTKNSFTICTNYCCYIIIIIIVVVIIIPGQTLGLKACCGSVSSVLSYFPGSPTAFLSLNLTVHNLLGNSIFSHPMYVVFPMLSPSVNAAFKISMCGLFIIFKLISSSHSLVQ